MVTWLACLSVMLLTSLLCCWYFLKRTTRGASAAWQHLEGCNCQAGRKARLALERNIPTLFTDHVVDL